MINTNRNLTREQQEEWNEKVKPKLSDREEWIELLIVLEVLLAFFISCGITYKISKVFNI